MKLKRVGEIALCAGLVAVITGGGVFYARRETAYRQKKIEPMATYRLSAFTEVDTRSELRLCAHRGLSATTPENTLESVRAAGEAGYAFVQLDVACTKDGRQVLLHDETVDRMTAGRGRIASFTCEQLARLPLDNGANVEKYDRVNIPLLKDVLEVCAQYGMQPILSLRTVRGAPDETVLGKAYMVVSTQKDVLELLKGTAAKLCYRTDALTDRDLRYCAQHGFAVAFDPMRTSDDALRKAQELDLWAWPVNTRDTLARLAKRGVRSMVTDCILPTGKK